jgi:deoxyadenosine/deoxycytidine kinase
VLAQRLNATLLEEMFEENPFLESFINNLKNTLFKLSYSFFYQDIVNY